MNYQYLIKCKASESSEATLRKLHDADQERKLYNLWCPERKLRPEGPDLCGYHDCEHYCLLDLNKPCDDRKLLVEEE